MHLSPILDYPFGRYHLDAYPFREALMRVVWGDAFRYFERAHRPT